MRFLGPIVCIAGILLAEAMSSGAFAGETPVMFSPGTFPGERIATFTIAPEVRVSINAPETNAPGKPLLVFYALPNGNTIEQTAGRKVKPGDDWRFGIQHIAAQTRFLRKALPEQRITVAYLESAQKSWPAWRKAHGNGQIPEILNRVAQVAGCREASWALTGHSGGGSLSFGLLYAVDALPTNLVRIAFLDSNYAYEREAHLGKLSNWLKDPAHFLCVLAYNDAVVSLNGKPIVSATGGTWGRTHAMLEDFSRERRFDEMRQGSLRKLVASNGRVQFYLHENPDKKILHTVQVERNGFIHAMLSGTPLDQKGYAYFGEPAWMDYMGD